MKGSEEDDEYRWGPHRGMAEDGVNKAKRPVVPVHVLTAPRCSTSASPGSGPALGIPVSLDSTLRRRGAVNSLVSENTNVNKR